MVHKYQPGIIVIVNVMMLAFISKPHTAELHVRQVFFKQTRHDFHCTTVFVLLPTNPTLDSFACMRCVSVPIHFSATQSSLLARLKKSFQT